MGFGEVCVKKSACGCFSLRANGGMQECTVRIRIAASADQLQSSQSCFCKVWLQEKAIQRGKGNLKFTFSFHGRRHTMPLAIRILKIVQSHDRHSSSKDSVDCRVYVSQRDFRSLEEINKVHTSKVEKLLFDAAQHDAFAGRSDLIIQKLEECDVAIFPDSEGFVLFKDNDERSSRPEHVLLRIRPTCIELCGPQFRSILPTFSSERHPVTSLQEALMDFKGSTTSWPLVRRGQFGVDWYKDRQTCQPRLGTARVEDQWETEEEGCRDATFLDDTVQNIHMSLNADKAESVIDEVQWKVDSVKSLVREAACISLHENVSVYLAIERATAAILSQCIPAAEAFVESAADIIRTHGSDCLGVYKLLASTMDSPAVKKAIMQMDMLTMLQEQYELMTQSFDRTSTSESNRSQCSTHEAHMEINKMEYFTCPREGELGPSRVTERPPSCSEAIRTHTNSAPSTRYQVLHTGSEGTTISTLSVDLLEPHPLQSSNSCLPSAPNPQDQRQEVPKLTFYWLSQHEGIRSTNTETTHTTISLPDGRSIVFDDDLKSSEMAYIPPRGLYLKEKFSTPRSQLSANTSFVSPQTVIDSTLHAWGVKTDEELMDDVPVAFAIKCTILEIMCAFSRLNLESEICEECEDSRDFKMLNGFQEEMDFQNPMSMAVLELLAPRWQVFPGEQPSIRWGPSDHGTHVALALLHEFACRPLSEKESPTGMPIDMRIFLPQDLHTESYQALLTGAQTRLSQLLQFTRIDSCTLEEASSVVHLLCDFVSSSPSAAPAQLVTYSCSNLFLTLEESIFKSYQVSNWPVHIFRLFHSLLRLFKCMLDKASDVVLEEFLISFLLKRETWVKMVREYSSALHFNERLARKCDPEELICLRSVVWCYHTALVKVVCAQRAGAEKGHENLPRDFQNTQPIAFGQDPLDFLRFLVYPGEGHAPRVLQKRDWGYAHNGSPINGGIHAQVLLFLKTLFSVPNNGFVKQRDIASYYLEFHWNGFKQTYSTATTRSVNNNSTALCRLHLEAIRVIMGHHHVEIFAQVLRLGIMDCLADEIALEASHSTKFGSFNPPVSQFSKGVAEQTELNTNTALGKTSSSKNGLTPLRCKEPSISTTDGESGFSSSIEFPSSDGRATAASQSVGATPKEDMEPNLHLTNSISFGMREMPATPSKNFHRQRGPSSLSVGDVGSSRQRHVAQIDRSNTNQRRALRSEEMPSRIPIFKSRTSSSKDKETRRRSSPFFSRAKRSEAKSSNSSVARSSRFLSVQTKIPCPPPLDLYSVVEPVARSPPASTDGSSKKSGSRASLGSLFSKKSKSSPKPEGSSVGVGAQFSRSVKRVGERVANRLRIASGKTALPGLSPPAKLTAVQRTAVTKSNSKSHKSLEDKIRRASTRRPDGGMRATISYGPSGLLMTRLSVESDGQSGDDALKSRSSRKSSASERSKKVPLLNLSTLNLPTKRPGIGQKHIHLDDVSLSSRSTSAMKKTISKPLDDDEHAPSGYDSHECSLEPDGHVAATLNPAFTSISGIHGRNGRNTHRYDSTKVILQRQSSDVRSFDEYCDSHGPPTFGIYCGARAEKEVITSLNERTQKSPTQGYPNLENLEQGNGRTPCVVGSCTGMKASTIAGSQPVACFNTPPDFEITGDIASDLNGLEGLGRHVQGWSHLTDSTASESDTDGEVLTEQGRERPIHVPLLRIGELAQGNLGRGIQTLPACLQSAIEPGSAVRSLSTKNAMSPGGYALDADEETRRLTCRRFSNAESRRTSPTGMHGHPSILSLMQPTVEASKLSWGPNSSDLSGFKTPSDFEYTGDVDEDVKKLERLEKHKLQGRESSVSFSSLASDDYASTVDCQYSAEIPQSGQRPVPKLNFKNSQKATALNPILPIQKKARGSTETDCSAVPSGDDMSSFSWMQCSPKEVVSESEFSALLNDTSKTNGSHSSADPYEAAKGERYVYSNAALRSIWVELLLEGMLLEYNTRPARDHDTHFTNIERIIRFIPKVLMHHLESEISKPVIALLTKKLSFQSPNIHRLLRLLTSSLFPAELYAKRTHIARGTFAHVFRCSLPVEGMTNQMATTWMRVMCLHVGGSEACVVKVMDHPVEHNEMSTLMDAYSEISIMNQFKQEPHVSHLYDYGIVDGSVFIVMKDYKCSLLEWRKRFPEQSPRAVRLFLRIFRSIIDAVKVLHDKNVVHFDLKCSNILLEPLPGISDDHFWNPPTEEPPFKVILGDFGEARSYSNDWEARTVRNRGTEYNKSPEMLLIAKAQETNGREYDRRKRSGAGPPSDVWALGCLLFELTTGEFLQYDSDWLRFFLRVTTNTMPVIDNDKQKTLANGGQTIVSDLLEFILVRKQQYRPNLTSLSQKIDSLMSEDELHPYIAPRSPRAASSNRLHKVTGRKIMSDSDDVSFQEHRIPSTGMHLRSVDPLKEQYLPSRVHQGNNADNDRTQSASYGITGKHRTPRSLARYNTVYDGHRMSCYDAGDEESVCDGHAEVIVNAGHSRCVCFTCETGFESDTFELILKTLHHLHPSTTEFENLMDIRRSLKTF